MQLLLNFQKEKINTVSAANALGKVKIKLLKLKTKMQMISTRLEL